MRPVRRRAFRTAGDEGGIDVFTGLIEEIGRIRDIRQAGETLRLSVEAPVVASDAAVGDSIAVNGVCLTVVAADRGAFSADVMPETFRRTALKTLRPGDCVNLERALRADGRLGGHLVQGHVDATGVIRSRTPDGNAVRFAIEPDDPSCMKYVVPRGSIAVDGVSLTVVSAAENVFVVSIIPHTLEKTVFRSRKPGDAVNLETDIIGRYVERLLGWRGGEGRSGLTEEKLRENGFI